MPKAIALLKLCAFALLCLVIVPPQLLIMLFTKGKASRILPLIWMKGVCAIFQIKVNVTGTPYHDTQCLYMSNHLSYLDILAIGSVIDYSFVSKQDVAKWPVFGFLANLRQTAYIGRATSDLKTASRAVSTVIEQGNSLILFPEGTSTDGREVIPFKSSLFSLVIASPAAAAKQSTPAPKRDLKLQPLTLFMREVNGTPAINQDIRDLYAWHRDMDTELSDHLWRFAQSSGATIEISFHQPINANDFSDRKALAKATHSAVSLGHQELTKIIHADIQNTGA